MIVFLECFLDFLVPFSGLFRSYFWTLGKPLPNCVICSRRLSDPNPERWPDNSCQCRQLRAEHHQDPGPEALPRHCGGLEQGDDVLFQNRPRQQIRHHSSKFAGIVSCIIIFYHILLQFVAETLMCLYRVSWTPLTPINVSGAKEKITNKSKNSTHVAICFIKNDEEILLNSPYSSDWCLCIESYRWANYHYRSNCDCLFLHGEITGVASSASWTWPTVSCLTSCPQSAQFGLQVRKIIKSRTV